MREFLDCEVFLVYPYSSRFLIERGFPVFLATDFFSLNSAAFSKFCSFLCGSDGVVLFLSHSGLVQRELCQQQEHDAGG